MQAQEGAQEFHLSQDHTSRENCKMQVAKKYSVSLFTHRNFWKRKKLNI